MNIDETFLSDYFASFINYERKVQRIDTSDFEEFKARAQQYFQPEIDKLKIFHIVGTKGKTSVTSLLQKALCDRGFSVGTFTSPHLQSYTERIRINGENIGHDTLYQYLKDVEQKGAFQETPGFKTVFELLFLSAVKWFADQNVDYVIFETGLGGRLDVTNIFDRVERTVFTPIALDHVAILGDTIEKIAREKGAVIKVDSQVFSAPQADDARRVLLDIAFGRKASISFLDPLDIHIAGLNKNTLLINGNEYCSCKRVNLATIENIWLVKDVMHSCGYEMDRPALEALLDHQVKGRWELFASSSKQTVILDGSHCPFSAANLKKNIQLYFPNSAPAFVLSVMQEKDLAGMLRALDMKDAVYYYFPLMYPRAMKYEPMKQIVSDCCSKELVLLDESFSADQISADLICATGSFYHLEKVFKCLL